MPGLPPIEWRVHLSCAPEQAFAAWATDDGRERFWAERSRTTDAGFRLDFIGGETLDVSVLEAAPPHRLVFSYFGGSQVTVSIHRSADGCEVALREEGVPAEEHVENYAGWVSVLLALKAHLNFGVDLRGHDPARSWAQRYVEN